MKNYIYAVFIGRFQPFHKGHLHNIKKGLEIAHNIIIIIGSSYRAPSITNPFSFSIRKQMIIADLLYVKINIKRIIIISAQDWIYNDKKWKEEIELKIKKYTKNKNSVIIIGHQKNNDNFYLKNFEWKYIDFNNYRKLNATNFRKKFFSKNQINTKYMISNSINKGSAKILKKFKSKPIFFVLKKEYIESEKNKKSYGTYKCKIQIVNNRILFVYRHKLLLIKYRNQINKKLWSLPKGKIKINKNKVNIFFYNAKNKKIILKSLYNKKDSIHNLIFNCPEQIMNLKIKTKINFIIMSKNNYYLQDLLKLETQNIGKWFNTLTVYKKMQSKLINDQYQIIKYIFNKYNLIAE